MKTLAATLIVAAALTSTAHAQFPFPPSPTYPLHGGSIILHEGAFSPGRPFVMPGTAPIFTPNGVHWLGVDGRPHGQFQDLNGNTHVYSTLKPTSSPSGRAVLGNGSSGIRHGVTGSRHGRSGFGRGTPSSIGAGPGTPSNTTVIR